MKLVAIWFRCASEANRMGQYITWTLDWTGLDWTQKWTGKQQFAGVGVACNRSLVSTVTCSQAENKLYHRVNTPGKTHHEAAVRLHMLC